MTNWWSEIWLASLPMLWLLFGLTILLPILEIFFELIHKISLLPICKCLLWTDAWTDNVWSYSPKQLNFGWRLYHSYGSYLTKQFNLLPILANSELMIGFLGHTKIAPILQLIDYCLLPICKDLILTDVKVFINLLFGFLGHTKLASNISNFF